MTWQPSPSALAASPSQYVRYDDAGPWIGEAGCATSPTLGATALGAYLLATFPGVRSADSLDCRPNTADASQTSIHGVGRAVDAMVPDGSRYGDAVADWLVEHAAEIGVQYVIWDHVAWNGSRATDKFRPYTGPNPHTDHVHVELNEDGAAMRTPWFTARPSTLASIAVPVFFVGVLALGGYLWWTSQRRKP